MFGCYRWTLYCYDQCLVAIRGIIYCHDQCLVATSRVLYYHTKHLVAIVGPSIATLIVLLLYVVDPITTQTVSLV
jgi:hypothetical protein